MHWPVFTDSSPNQSYQFTSRPGDHWPVRIMILAGLLFMGAFVWVYVHAEHQEYSWLYILLTISVLFKLLRLLHEWYHYWTVRPSVPPPVTRTWTVDVLTTYCPGEPKEMVINTLQAIQRLTYPHTAYLCDEADDPELKQRCAELNVRHVTRTVKTNAKAGNINHALQQATGDVCLVLDPDHVPVPDFLEHVLPHFEDPAVGFVQCVQGYYNRSESLVAYGAAEQTYSFYGPMMTCMNAYGTVQAIGANCTFRRSALDSIGGHANGLSEDMHTAMRLHAGGWRSVYVPLPLSYGLVPATLAAYYKQQLKWARGTFELLFTTVPRLFGRFTFRQQLHYATLPLYYLIGLVQLIDLLIPILSLVLMKLPLRVDLLLFATAYVPLLLTGFLIRQYAQRWLIERHEAGFHLMGGMLTSGTWWVYVLGLLYTIFRVKVPYIPTPKDDRPRNNGLLVLPNLLFCLATLGAISYSIYWYGRFTFSNLYAHLMIGFGLVNVCILSLNVLIGQEKTMAWANGQLQERLRRRHRRLAQLHRSVWAARYVYYARLRQYATPLFGSVLLLTPGLAFFTYQRKTATPPAYLRYATTQPFYLGLSASAGSPAGGSVPVAEPIVPERLGWPVAGGSFIAEPRARASAGQIPLLYIEPTGLTHGAETDLNRFLTRILAGECDAALDRFARSLNARPEPLLVSFMPEFDNPARAWGTRQDETLALYRQVWQYVVARCRATAGNVTWLWCPTQAATLVLHHPGSDYIDWLGLPALDDPATAPDRKSHSFATHIHDPFVAVRMHRIATIREKPILLTRLGTTLGEPGAQRWLAEAVDLMQERYPQIRGALFTNVQHGKAYGYRLLNPVRD